MTDFQDITFAAADGVATITLNRPEAMNTWTSRMATELWQALELCDTDDSIRAVVLTGAGDRAFCAGADLSRGRDTFDRTSRQEYPEDDAPDEARDDAAPAARLLPHQISKPVIAAINGHAVGVGMTYPMLADIRIVAENAKLAFPFVRRGVLPELGSHVTVAKVAGLSNAADLLLTGRTIKGKEAAQLGIASVALPQQEVLPHAMAIARDIAANTAPASVAIAKRFLWDGLDASVDNMMAREEPVFAWIGSQPDAKEGVSAFVDKRPPNWSMSTADIPQDFLRPDR